VAQAPTQERRKKDEKKTKQRKTKTNTTKTKNRPNIFKEKYQKHIAT
jgi:hypothetical protein